MAKDISKKKETTTEIHGAAVPLKWYISNDIITRFASNMVVQILENEFKVSFFEISPDIVSGIEQKLPNEVPANCVASVIITADRLPKFIEVLQTQYNQYVNLKSKNLSPAS
jgi:hypothetical protein